jgi:predicted RNase H-like HicB family nuclease
MKFNLSLELDEEGAVGAECTDLPGCLSKGETVQEAIENISEAIVGCLKSRLKLAGEQLKIPAFYLKPLLLMGPSPVRQNSYIGSIFTTSATARFIYRYGG